jgi:hypothetical protein
MQLERRCTVARRSHNGTAGLDLSGRNKGDNTMTQSRRDKLDHDQARKWLAAHAPKQASKPKPKPKRRERWQMRKQEQTQERRALATPLLKGVR